jgi:hypothetical protein
VASEFDFAPYLVEATGEPPNYATALARLAETPGAPLLIPGSPRFYRDRAALLALLLERRVPAISAFPEHAEVGASLSYGVSVVAVRADQARQQHVHI